MSAASLASSARQDDARPEPHTLGMLVFIASEATFFVFLLIAYISYWNSNLQGPGPSQALDIGRTANFTVCLLSSSFTVWLAERRLKRGDARGFQLFMGLTIVLGLAFVAGQAIEYHNLVDEHVTLGRNLFGSTFFTLTGFHGLHVIVGLILLALATGLSTRGAIRSVHSPALRCIVYYWHFVDAVWVVLFSTIYLWTAHG